MVGLKAKMAVDPALMTSGHGYDTEDVASQKESMRGGNHESMTDRESANDSGGNEDDTVLYNVVRCKYVSRRKLCKFLTQNPVLMPAREELCTYVSKNACCYFCDDREQCRIGCDWQDDTEEAPANRSDKQARLNRATRKCEERMARLAGLLADGKISEQSYRKAVKDLECKINRLK